jgi:hypothetical protein
VIVQLKTKANSLTLWFDGKFAPIKSERFFDLFEHFLADESLIESFTIQQGFIQVIYEELPSWSKKLRNHACVGIH